MQSIKQIPNFFRWTPVLKRYNGFTIYPYIFLPQSTIQKLKSDKPDIDSLATLAHEQTHIQRQKQTGWLKWGLFYIFSPKYRFNEELKAIKSSMIILKKHNQKFNAKHKAKVLSGWLYFKSTSYKNALRELNKTWNNI